MEPNGHFTSKRFILGFCYDEATFLGIKGVLVNKTVLHKSLVL